MFKRDTMRGWWRRKPVAGILTGTAIERLIRDESDYKKKLLITPLLFKEQIGPASVDIRLGSTIVVPRKTFVGSFDVTKQQLVPQVRKRLYEEIRLKYHKEFVLHPNEMILAGTFEYICLPRDVFATVATKSSWGRLGLVIATASVVQPGFRGSLTLELCNLSETPLTLYPGLLIGQLVLHRLGQKAVPYKGKYQCPTEAAPPKFLSEGQRDREMRFWGIRRPEQSGQSENAGVPPG